MRQNDVDESVVEEILKALKEQGIDNNSSVNEVFAIFKKEIIKRLGASEEITVGEQNKPKVIMFLGPTGVGKTTTLAKIAANFMIKEGKKVGLITADTYRIAAVEQLKTYSEIMGTPITVIYSPKEMKDAIKKNSESDLIFPNPTISSPSVMPKIKVPPDVFAKALTLLSQLFTFLRSIACFLSYSVASPINSIKFIHNPSFRFINVWYLKSL